MEATTDVYRDATFTKTTRDRLAAAADALRLEVMWTADERRTRQLLEYVGALDDVIHRWDENDATEFEAEAQ